MSDSRIEIDSKIKINKKKILCLHGGGQSASSFSQQQGMKDLANSLNEHEFIFAESTLGNYTWWSDPIDKDTPTIDTQQAAESVIYLTKFINENGPFDCILGFSQGAAMALVYISQQVHNFNKIILFNGYLPTTHYGLMSIIESNSPYDLEALIFIGQNDVFYNMSLELKSKFINFEEVISSSAGHHPPSKSDPTFKKVVGFIKGESLSTSELETEYQLTESNQVEQEEGVNIIKSDGSESVSIISSGYNHRNVLSNFSGTLNTGGKDLEVNFNERTGFKDN